MDALKLDADIEKLVSIPIRESIGRFKYVPISEINTTFDEILFKLQTEIDEIINEGEG